MDLLLALTIVTLIILFILVPDILILLVLIWIVLAVINVVNSKMYVGVQNCVGGCSLMPSSSMSSMHYNGSININDLTNCQPVAQDECLDIPVLADEKIARQGLSRNDITKVIDGTMRRTRELIPIFKEELDEEEKTVWWGEYDV